MINKVRTQNSELRTIFIVGPTASGKSDLAMWSAEKIDGEIVCADSQTIRRGMNIGTAKPSGADRARVRHHLLDIIDPYDEFSLADFLAVVRPVIAGIHARKKVAIVVGGTGLYIDALFFGFELPELSKSLYEKVQLEQKSTDDLQKIIRDNSYILPANTENPRHLINVILRAGNEGLRGEPDDPSSMLGICPDKEVLAERINARVDAMFDGGFLAEVQDLLRVYGEPSREFDAIGYKIAMQHLKGELSLDDAKELFKLRDRQYAKRQMSWLKRNKYIVWYPNPNQAYDAIIDQ